METLSTAPRILVVEDQEPIQELVTAMLRTKGLSCDAASSLAAARERMTADRYDLLFVDVNLPDGSGLSLIGGGGADLPLVVVMTGRSDIETAVDAIRHGAVDFITKPFSVGDFLQRVDKSIEEWKARVSLQLRARSLETLVRAKAEELLRSSRQIEQVHDATVLTLGTALNLKDRETADHCGRVSLNAVKLGSLLGLSEFELRNLRWGSYLHDVGKIGVPERILLKRGPLTPEERRIMERHPVEGYRMIRNIGFLSHSADVVLSHHERYDGTGYPHGLGGEMIPLHARIFPIMDALDAMTSDRPYRAALPLPSATAEIERATGSQFDPEIAEVFLSAPPSSWLVQDRDSARE